MSTSRLIEKRLLWAAVLAFVTVGVIVYMGSITWGIGDKVRFSLGVIFMHIMFTCFWYSGLSLINTLFCLASRGGIHNDAVGVIGGVVLGIGVITFWIEVGNALFNSRFAKISVTAMGISFVLVVVGLTLTVKG